MFARVGQQQYNADYYLAHKQRSNAASSRYREKHKDDPAHRAKRRVVGKAWWDKNGRDLGYRRRHGITAAEFDVRVAKQNNRCPIGNHVFGSGRQWNSPVLDHDHETGKHRDILCRTHNFALGGFHDSVEELTDAIRYVKKHKGA